MSGGQIMRRSATPSSSIRANAAASWSRGATRTDRPDNSERRPPRLVPRRRLPRDTLVVAPHRKRPEQSDPSPSLFEMDVRQFGGIFIEPDKLSHVHLEQAG